MEVQTETLSIDNISSCSIILKIQIVDKFLLICLCDNLGYLFEGHLTVDPEPPQPQWLVQSNLLTTAATLFAAESSQGLEENNTSTENAASLLQELMGRLGDVLPLVLPQFPILAFHTLDCT